MRKLIAVVVLVGGMLAGAGSATVAQAQPSGVQAGLGDPLTLAFSGVLIPYLTSAGRTSVVEVASPHDENFDLHLVFFNNTCVRGPSIPLVLSTNDIGFVTANLIVAANTDGIVAIGSTFDGVHLDPLSEPIHSRVYSFNVSDGRSLVLEPIIIDTFTSRGLDPSGGNNASGFLKLWSPLRTAATFFAPFETASVKTRLTLICPRSTIQNGTTTNLGIFPIQFSGSFVFPAINPPFNSGATPMSGRVYDTNELFLRDVSFTCDCLTEISVNDINGIYSLSPDPLTASLGALNGTYTEIFVTDPNPDSGNTTGSFTGYKNSFTVGSPQNFFWGRLSNDNRAHIAGTHANPFDLTSANNANLKTTNFPFSPTSR